MEIESKVEEIKKDIYRIDLIVAKQSGGIDLLIEKIESTNRLLLELKQGIALRVQQHETEIAIIHNDLRFIKQEKLSKIDDSLTSIDKKIDDKFDGHEREHKEISIRVIGALVAAILSLIGVIYTLLIRGVK